MFLPVHAYMFATAGAQIIEVVNMEEIAAEKQYEFAFLGFPLKLRGATGAPMPSYAVPLRTERLRSASSKTSRGQERRHERVGHVDDLRDAGGRPHRTAEGIRRRALERRSWPRGGRSSRRAPRVRRPSRSMAASSGIPVVANERRAGPAGVS